MIFGMVYHSRVSINDSIALEVALCVRLWRDTLCVSRVKILTNRYPLKTLSAYYLHALLAMNEVAYMTTLLCIADFLKNVVHTYR